LINPANRKNTGFSLINFILCIKTIHQNAHNFGVTSFVNVALCQCPFMGLVTLRVANNVTVTVKDKKHRNPLIWLKHQNKQGQTQQGSDPAQWQKRYQ
jgi:hypothetical protein